MSGFVGLANTGGAPADAPLLHRLTDAMAYFAPDGRDTWSGGPVGLGHALLGLAPEAGRTNAERQPASLDGRTWIAADARIDARPELTRELRAAGRDVSPDAPDAYLVLHAYAAWHERCPEHLIGDFAFAIWDGDRRELLCARDQFGVVPFYYAAVDQGLVFGNVLGVLLSHPGVSDTLNEQAIGHFLAFDWNHNPTTTTFADIRSLPAAHALTWHEGRLSIRRYWDLEDALPEVRQAHPEEYVERFAVTLERAVEDRLPASPVAAHLSGGMDSSSVVATAGAVLDRRGERGALHAYTVVFGDLLPEDEEGVYAEQIASRLDVPLEKLVADDYLARPPDGEVQWMFPEPLRIINQMPDYDLLARAAGRTRVLLTGQGGDPLFRSTPPAWASLLAGRPRFGIRTALRRWRGVRHFELPEWIDDDLAARLDLSALARTLDAEVSRPGHMSGMTSPFWSTLFARGHPGALGLPIRPLFPFFDMRLMRCVAETPILPWHPGKRLLREAMRDRLPRAVLVRPKTPLHSSRSKDPEPWLRLARRPEVRRQRERLLEVPELNRYVDLARARHRVESPSSPGMFQFERCLALAQWLQAREDSDVENPG